MYTFWYNLFSGDYEGYLPGGYEGMYMPYSHQSYMLF